MRRTITRSVSTLGTSSAALSTTVSYCITNDPIFGLASEIDKDIDNEDALDIDGDGVDSNVEGDEFELHMNSNETEYSIEEYSITGEGNVQKVSHKNFMKVTDCGYMEVIGEIAVENSMSFQGFKIPNTPYDYVPSEANTIKIEPALESIDNPGQWSRYCYRPKLNAKRGTNYVHHA